MKNIITLDEFNAYSSNYEDSCEVKLLKEQILDTATEIVEDYLNHSIRLKDCIEVLKGTNQKKLYLHNVPICDVYEVQINDHYIDPLFIKHNEECIMMNGVFKEDSEILVRYTAGYNQNNIPSLIKTTILRIATLLLMEGGENIGITGKVGPDGNSRTFINYTNFDKYLKPLDKYKTFEI